MSTVSTRTPLPRLATLEDLLAIPEDRRFHEILDGELVEKEAARAKHAHAQGEVRGVLQRFRGAPNGPARPGGWWLLTEVTLRLSPHQIVRPDVAGWRRDRLLALPDDFSIELRPDWVCEVSADGNSRRRDGLQKRRIYAEHGVPHYWLVDLLYQRLTVLRLSGGVFQEVLEADRSERIRAEPFEALELSVGALFGDDSE
jgi:Uma2 family endonuclease